MDRFYPNSRLGISWEPLPCHLQNGGDVGYIIQYSLAGDSEVRSFFTSARTPYIYSYESEDIFSLRPSCRLELLGLRMYSCYFTSLMLLEDQTYTFQVAAINGYGVGPLSISVSARLQSQKSMIILVLYIS